ncbi:Antitoxin HigA-2 [Ferriphaselus amnicola]|uniref:Antitoxin HigA-2 n=1 Tax=Ferriphaselus amnicola TaxID=1188319 RepID=A0A2Z6GCS0_9PROT|nr:type II toxin-antitoxin system MqsA family antitoxin [Ferriphaselus amnicola]BBE50955.1 Antitoxin HigA-2 [Ferriphaselus amnicola]
MTPQELVQRDASRDLGAELLESVRQMKAGHAAKTHHIDAPLALTARMKSGLSQSDFAKLFGVSLRTLKGWEQGHKNPGRAARTLIAIAERHPDVLRDLAVHP